MSEESTGALCELEALEQALRHLSPEDIWVALVEAVEIAERNGRD